MGLEIAEAFSTSVTFCLSIGTTGSGMYFHSSPDLRSTIRASPDSKARR